MFVAGSVLLALAVAALCGSLVEAELVRRDERAHPASGRLVEVDGGTWRIECSGTKDSPGDPTIVLEAGLGDSGLSWAGIQPDLAERRRVCSYDRAGYGWSAPRAGVRDADTVSGELHALLGAADEAGPVLLVGHSLGGVIARRYASRYPGDVAGIVLVDPSNDASLLATGEPVLPIAVTRVQAFLSCVGVLRPFLPLLVADEGGARPPEALTDATSYLYRAGAIDAAAAELSASLRSATQLAHPALDASLPVLTILTRDSEADTEHFAALSEGARVINAGASGHYVHYSEPAFVVAAIEEMLAEIQR